MVYVDNINKKFRNMIMNHMVADTIEELHEMADTIGVDRKHFQLKSSPHYDICLSKKKLTIEAGAKEIDFKETIRVLNKMKKKK